MEPISAPVLAALECGGTVVTADPHQAYRLRLAWADLQRVAGRTSWPTPEVMPIGAALSRAWLGALIDEETAQPHLLSLHQERALWDQIVRETGGEQRFLQPHGTARAVMRAWRRMQEWAVDPLAVAQSPIEEVSAFAQWAHAFAARCRQQNWTDAASALARMPLPRDRGPWSVVGFDAPSAALRALVTRFARAGVEARFVESANVEGRARRASFADPQAEWRAAANWARRRLLENPLQRLMVVIPDLERDRQRIEGTFGEVLRPAVLQNGAGSATVPFAIEGGVPLAGYAMVDTALTALAMAGGAQPFDVVSAWWRSSYLLGPGVREGDRARLDVEVRRHVPHALDLGSFTAALVRAARKLAIDDPLIVAGKRFRETLAGRRGLAEWSARVSDALHALGWPGVRERDSAEQQTLEKFNDTLAELATLDEIAGRVDVRGMLRHLRGLAEQTSFQPETGAAPLSISARLADPGLALDGLWVTGLEANAWPRAPRPDPFLPWDAQRAAGIPDASAEGTLAFAQRLTARWSTSAAEVIFSWPARIDDEACLPSALIHTFPRYAHADALGPPARDYWSRVRASANLERLADEFGPALPENAPMPGGAYSLTLQSQCAMRAFAERRLEASALEVPEPGIDARTHGSLVHHALWVLWSEIESQEELRALEPIARQRLLGTAVAQASEKYLERPGRWPARIVELERERLGALLEEWLAIELERSAFRVVSVESELPASLAGHPIDLRIDRIDELAGRRRLLIDYKTGALTPASWFGDRPEDAQLPVYAAVLEPRVDGIAIGRLRTGDCALKGASSLPAMLRGPYDPTDWHAQLALWRETVVRLAGEFAQGDARVNPRQPPETCRYCHLHSLCRIDELRVASVEDGDEDE